MGEFLLCVAVTAAWRNFCSGAGQLDTLDFRRRFFGQVLMRGDAWYIGNALALDFYLSLQPRVSRAPLTLN